jgi:hypothetical protein
MIMPTPTAAEQARANLVRVLHRTRTGLVPEILVGHDRPFPEILHESSADADLILMGMARPEGHDFAAYYESLQQRTIGLPATVFVLAAEDIAFREVLFREMAP